MTTENPLGDRTDPQNVMPGILLTFEQDAANAGAFNDRIADGKEFAHYVDLLDAMCDDIGIPTLSSFCIDAGDVPDERFPWFSPVDGLRTVDGLTRELINQNKVVKSKRKREIVEILIADMKALESDLKSARQTKSRFALIYC